MSLREVELSQFAGSSAGEGGGRQEDSPAVAVAAVDTADRSAPETIEFAGSSAGRGVKRPEDSPAAAAAVPLVSAPDTAHRSASELRQLAGLSTGRRGNGGVERQEVHGGIPEAEQLLGARVYRPQPHGCEVRIRRPLRHDGRAGHRITKVRPVRAYGCHGSHDCVAANGVLRVSMCVAFFFIIMFGLTVNTRKRYEVRNFLHPQWWIFKAVIFSLCYGFATYAPSSLLQFYGTVAHAGAWPFLAIQFFSMARFIIWVNGLCRLESNRQRWAPMTCGLLPLGGAPDVFAGLAFMYYWYAQYWEPTTGIPYGYGFFYLVFASGAMYIGMLFIGWSAHTTMEKFNVDISWASTRVRATSGFLVAICYILMLVSQDLWNSMLGLTSNATPADNDVVGTL